MDIINEVIRVLEITLVITLATVVAAGFVIAGALMADIACNRK